jgi:hypothetical protein
MQECKLKKITVKQQSIEVHLTIRLRGDGWD